MMEFQEERVPFPEIEEDHWKVGDGMLGVDGKPDFVISQIAVVLVDEEKKVFEIRYYDEDGEKRGAQRMRLVSKESDV